MRISSIGIFLTRRCGFRCLYCCAETGVDPPDKLTLDELQSVVGQARELGARWVIIPGEGEPLLDDNFFPVVDIARSLGMATKVYTNGSPLDADRTARLFANRVSVVFKLHALDEPTYHALAGIRSGHVPWEEVQCAGGVATQIPKGLRLLLEAGYKGSERARSGESLLQIESVVIKQNLGVLPDIARWCKSQGMDFMVETLLPTKVGGEMLSITPEEERALFRQLRRILGWKFGLSQRVRCRFETNPFVDVSGNLRHCFGLACDVGNIRNTSLAELHQRELTLRKQAGLISWPVMLGRPGFRRCATRRFSLDPKFP